MTAATGQCSRMNPNLQWMECYANVTADIVADTATSFCRTKMSTHSNEETHVHECEAYLGL